MTMDRFADLKTRQALTWGAAPFERITETFAEIHDRLIACLGPRPGETWLDVATGTGVLVRNPIGPILSCLRRTVRKRDSRWRRGRL